MNAVLVIEEGLNQGRKFSLPDGRSCLVGRSPENEIQIFGEDVSRSHCRITSQNGGFEIIDSSSNGTFVNGDRITRSSLKDGDVIRTGTTKFAFKLSEVPREERVQRDSELKFVPHFSKGERTQILKQGSLDQTILMNPSAAQADLESYRSIHQKLITVYKVGNLINSIENPEELYNTLMDTISDVVKPERSFLLLKDLQTDEITPVVARYESDAENEERLPLSQTIVQDCVTKGQHVLCPDAMMDERFNTGDSIFINKIRSVMCVPLESQKQILGAIYVDSSESGGEYTERDLELLSAIGRQAGISIERANLIHELEELAVWSIMTLVAAIEAKDEYTRGHSERVASFSVQIAEELGLGDRMIENIRLGGLLHDVGKIGVPEAVLLKPGRLTEEEFELIKLHPETGAYIIGQIDNPRLKCPTDIARHHHERWDGRGYPDGLEGDEISLPARIVSVADAYDAMSTARPYREPHAKEFIARQLLSGMATQFDPRAAKAFLKIWQEGRLRRPKTLQLELNQAKKVYTH